MADFQPAAPLVRLSRSICRAATGRLVAGSFLLFVIIAILINGRPFGLAQLQEIMGGPTIPDMTFTTGPDSMYAILAALGETGRAFDLAYIVPLDLLFPFTYALFLALAISYALARLLPEGSPWMLLNLAPVIAASADYCENAGIITLLLTYPARLDAVAWWTSVMYVIKLACSMVAWATLIAALAGCILLFINHCIHARPA